MKFVVGDSGHLKRGNRMSNIGLSMMLDALSTV